MLCTQSDKSSTHVEQSHYDYDIPGEHNDDILGEHEYFHGEFQS